MIFRKLTFEEKMRLHDHRMAWIELTAVDKKARAAHRITTIGKERGLKPATTCLR